MLTYFQFHWYPISIFLFCMAIVIPPRIFTDTQYLFFFFAWPLSFLHEYSLIPNIYFSFLHGHCHSSTNIHWYPISIFLFCMAIVIPPRIFTDIQYLFFFFAWPLSFLHEYSLIPNIYFSFLHGQCHSSTNSHQRLRFLASILQITLISWEV